MKFTLEIDMDNAAFSEFPYLELHRILVDVAENFATHDLRTMSGGIKDTQPVRDYNGNRVGEAAIIRGDDD